MKSFKQLAVLLIGLGLVLSLVIAQGTSEPAAAQQSLKLQMRMQQGQHGQGRFMHQNGQPRGQDQFQRRGPGNWDGRPSGFMMGLFPGGLASSLGTDITVTFYDGKPEAEANALSSHTLVIGQDSESAFMNALMDARADAAFARIDIGELNRSFQLDNSQAFNLNRLMLPVLNDGSTLTVNFYSDDPATGSNPVQTLSYIHGQDSALAFQQAVTTAAADAAFVSVSTSPQSIVRDLSLTDMPHRGLWLGRMR